MKKVLLFFFVLGFVCLTGCDKEGEDVTIRLEGNPTTGYDWNCVAEDSSIIIIEKEYEQSNSDKMLSGSGGTYEFEIEGLKEGSTTLICKYDRSFEEDSVIEQKEYIITVDKNTNVTYKVVK